VPGGRHARPAAAARPPAADVAALDGQVSRFAATLPGARVLPLDKAVDPTLPPDFTLGGGGQHTAALFSQPAGSDRADAVPLYVATPELLARFGAGTGDVN